MKNAKAGMYEYQLEAFYDLTIKQDGNKPTSFKTIAASGINATTLHYSTNNCVINDGDLVLFDLGCKDEGYCSSDRPCRIYYTSRSSGCFQSKYLKIILQMCLVSHLFFYCFIILFVVQ